MFFLKFNKHTVLALIFFCHGFKAQFNISFNLQLTPEDCNKGAANLTFTGRQDKDSVVINWSTGENNTSQVINLSGGEHNVRVFVKRVVDKKTFTKDTIVFFNTEKLECAIQVSSFFSPNDDQYNDVLNISNLKYYPDFELNIFNKWGQRVHVQRKEYTPWDGKWLGADLPDGTYYYVLFPDASNKNKLIKGDLTILR